MSETPSIRNVPPYFTKALLSEAADHIASAWRFGIVLNESDFIIYNGELYLDGMDPADWIRAVSGEDDE